MAVCRSTVDLCLKLSLLSHNGRIVGNGGEHGKLLANANRASVATLFEPSVVINLLDNAIKYSFPGGRISVRVVRRDPASACIEVEDCGQGIPPEHRDRVFDRFCGIDEGRSREAGGAGLGLALVPIKIRGHVYELMDSMRDLESSCRHLSASSDTV